MSLTSDQVVALAPDAGSVKAGRGLASPRSWQLLGGDDGALWGLCKGSGSRPYQVQIDLSEPAFKCSCPSRKFPCKHALALLFLSAEQAAALSSKDRPPWLQEWLQSRMERATKSANRNPDHDAKPVDAAAQAKRRAKRAGRVEDGVAVLARWLEDLVRQGLAEPSVQNAAFWQPMQKRLVDAQAPGLAGRVGELGECLQMGPTGQASAMMQIGRLRLLAHAYSRRADLSEPLQAALQQAIGIPVAKEVVLAGEPVLDEWLVAGRETSERERLLTTVTWLLGRDTARWAQLVSTVPTHLPQQDLLPLGETMRGALCFYPGVGALRAHFQDVPQRVIDVSWQGVPPCEPFAAMVARHAAALAELPWLRETPVLCRVRPERHGTDPVLVDEHGAALLWRAGPLVVEFLRAVTGGHAALACGIWDGSEVRLLAVLDAGEWLAMPASGALARRQTGAWFTWNLLGTSRSASPPDCPSQAIAAAWSQIDWSQRESATLSGNALWAVAQSAGAPLLALDPPAVTGMHAAIAPEEPHARCSDAVSSCLRQMLDGRYQPLLHEWLQCMRAGNLVVAHRDLPLLLAFGNQNEHMRDDLREALGERGRWLAADNPMAAWAVAGDALDEQSWTDGTPAEGLRFFVRLFAVAPEQAATRLQTAWDEESGEQRERLLAVVASKPPNSLGQWLFDKPLKDRRTRIRQDARTALLRLPSHAMHQRAQQRARQLVRVDGVLKKRLLVTLPEQFDPAWRDDGIVEKPPQGIGTRTFWARQLLASVPLQFWLDTFHTDLATLMRWNRDQESAELLQHAWIESLLLVPQPEALQVMVATYLLEDRWPEKLLGRTAFVRQQLQELAADDASNLVDLLLTRRSGTVCLWQMVLAGEVLPKVPNERTLAQTLVAACQVGVGRAASVLLARAVPRGMVPAVLAELSARRDLTSDLEEFVRVLEFRQFYLQAFQSQLHP